MSWRPSDPTRCPSQSPSFNKKFDIPGRVVRFKSQAKQKATSHSWLRDHLHFFLVCSVFQLVCMKFIQRTHCIWTSFWIWMNSVKFDHPSLFPVLRNGRNDRTGKPLPNAMPHQFYCRRGSISCRWARCSFHASEDRKLLAVANTLRSPTYNRATSEKFPFRASSVCQIFFLQPLRGIVESTNDFVRCQEHPLKPVSTPSLTLISSNTCSWNEPNLTLSSFCPPRTPLPA